MGFGFGLGFGLGFRLGLGLELRKGLRLTSPCAGGAGCSLTICSSSSAVGSFPPLACTLPIVMFFSFSISFCSLRNRSW